MNAFGRSVRSSSLALAAGSLSTLTMAQTIPSAASTQAEPAGKWTIEYGDWQCVLHRDLSVAGQPAKLSLAMEPLTPTAWLRIGVNGGGGRRDGNDAVMFMDGQRLPGALHYNAYAEGP